jgi:hypothetical protein
MAKAATKTGVDDYLAGGGTVAELLLRARPFEPEDLARKRLRRDKGLGTAVADLWRAWWEMPARKMAECSKRAVMRDLTQAAGERGKLQTDGVFVVRSIRDIAVGAQLSLGGTKNTLDRLEAEGRLRREMWGRAKDKPGAYVLLTPWGGGSAVGEHNGKGDGAEEDAPQEREGFSPLSKAPYDRGVHVTRAPSDEVPELRWPKVVHTWGWREGRRVVVDSFYVRRPGKRRGEIVRYLLENGRATVAELVQAFGAKRARPRDFRRRILGPLEAEGVIAVVGDEAELTPAWREALEGVRDRGDEIQDARLQAEKFEREKKAFRQAGAEPAEPTPATMGRDHVRRTLEHHRPRWAQEEAEELRKMVRPAAEFARDILERQEYVRLGLLEEMWAEAGGLRRHLRIALRELGCTAKRHAEHPGELFVYRGAAWPRSDERPAASVVPIPNGAPVIIPEEDARSRKPYKRADGVYVHPPECACEWCEEPPARSYATPVKIGSSA